MSKAITAMTNNGIELSMSDGDIIDSDPEEFQMQMMSDNTEESDDDIAGDYQKPLASSKELLSENSDIPSENEMQMEFESASDTDDDIERVEE